MINLNSYIYVVWTDRKTNQTAYAQLRNADITQSIGGIVDFHGSFDGFNVRPLSSFHSIDNITDEEIMALLGDEGCFD